MNLLEQLRRDEGLRLTPYKDSRGIWTCGYGHNLVAHDEKLAEITKEQAEQWLREDAEVAIQDVAYSLPWSANLDDARRGVLENMAFNLGIKGLMGFHRTLNYVETGNYAAAAQEMLYSDWAKQVGARAERLSVQMKHGVWQ